MGSKSSPPTDDLLWSSGRPMAILGVRMPGRPLYLHAALMHFFIFPSKSQNFLTTLQGASRFACFFQACSLVESTSITIQSLAQITHCSTISSYFEGMCTLPEMLSSPWFLEKNYPGIFWLYFQLQFMLLFSRQGKLRLQKWYNATPDKQKKKVTRELITTVLARKPKMCNFLEWRDLKIVYKR